MSAPLSLSFQSIIHLSNRDLKRVCHVAPTPAPAATAKGLLRSFKISSAAGQPSAPASDPAFSPPPFAAPSAASAATHISRHAPRALVPRLKVSFCPRQSATSSRTFHMLSAPCTFIRQSFLRARARISHRSHLFLHTPSSPRLSRPGLVALRRRSPRAFASLGYLVLRAFLCP